MRFIDPHIHMTSRTTADYALMAEAGIVAVCEPAFWLGTDRQFPESHLDYFNHLTTFEPRRAEKRGIKHYQFLGVNPKESENVDLAKAVLERIDPYLERPTVLGIGEIGLNLNTDHEIAMFRRQLEMAKKKGLLAVVHTPHGEAKAPGTEIIVDVVLEVDPPRETVVIDHCTAETIEMARRSGCWTGLTVYPTKLSCEDAARIVRDFGPERMLVNSSADWEDSDPLAVVETVGTMRSMGLPDTTAERVVWHNPTEFLGQGPKFKV